MTVLFSSIFPHLQVATIKKLQAEQFVRFSLCSRSSSQMTKFLKTKIILDVQDCTLNPHQIHILRQSLPPSSRMLTLQSLPDNPICIKAKILRTRDMYSKHLCGLFESINPITIRAIEVDCHFCGLDSNFVENTGKLLELLKVESATFAIFNSLEHHKSKEKKLKEFTNFISLFLNNKNIHKLSLEDPYGEPRVDYFLFDKLLHFLPFSVFEFEAAFVRGLHSETSDYLERAFVADNNGRFILIYLRGSHLRMEKINEENNAAATRKASILLGQLCRNE